MNIKSFSLNIFYCQTYKGVGLQVLTTLITARPLQHIYNNSVHGKHKKLYNAYNYFLIF